MDLNVWCVAVAWR